NQAGVIERLPCGLPNGGLTRRWPQSGGEAFRPPLTESQASSYGSQGSVVQTLVTGTNGRLTATVLVDAARAINAATVQEYRPNRRRVNETKSAPDPAERSACAAALIFPAATGD